MTLRSRNFAFLAARYPALEAIAAGAEVDWRAKPVACLMQLRLFAEQLARQGCALLRLPTGGLKNFTDLLDALVAKGMPDDVLRLFDALRSSGNAAAHSNRGTGADALARLQTAHQLAEWFYRTSVDPRYVGKPFVTPDDPFAQSAQLQSALARSEQQLAALSAEAAAAQALVEKAVSDAERALIDKMLAEQLAAQALEEKKLWEQLAAENEKLASEKGAKSVDEFVKDVLAKAQEAAKKIVVSEAEARETIDAQLAAAGWEVSSKTLTYANGARPEATANRAIAEWPTEDGEADYVLFAGKRALGVVEAKRKNTDVRGKLEQARRYADAYKVLAGEALPAGSPWGKHRVPFVFSANGRAYHPQLETKSGIWFQDLRVSSNLPRALKGFYSPDGLLAELARDTARAHAELAKSPVEQLGLRTYQANAISAVEKALAQGKRRCLVAMATGTGKTRTAVGLLYRLLEANRFRRVLFLVDRTTLGDQTYDVVRDFKVAGEQTLAQVFGVLGLDASLPETDTRLQIATVQGLMARVLHADPARVPPVDTYDCIVVDECHRGYTLDKELSEAELAYRDPNDYLSKYRRVLDHFDAVKIGLTATPALHTLELFEEIVFSYTYTQAVFEGYLVPQEPARRIITEQARDGITYRVGDAVTQYVPEKDFTLTAPAEDELRFEVDSFNDRIIVEGFNKVVCEHLARELDPTSDDKTIVYCVNDAHADLVVHLLSQALQEQWGPLDADTVMKITGAAERPEQRVKRFKNERVPSVAVTVDLLSTGVDVPAVATLVFLRRVKSRILYEQMLGRATRLCPKTRKEYYRVFDAVNQLELVGDQSDMVPRVVTPKHSFTQLLGDLLNAPDESLRKQALDEFVAKLRRKRRAVEEKARDEFREKSGGLEPRDLLRSLVDATPEEAAVLLAKCPEAVGLLDRVTGTPVGTVVHQGEDRLVEVTQRFEGKSAGDYLADFERFVKENMNAVPALLVLAKRPKELTRAQLSEVVKALDAAGFREVDLRSAFRSTLQEDAARLVGYVRHCAVGDALVSYDKRVDDAVARVLKKKPWNAVQTKWIRRLGEQLKQEVVVDRAALDQGMFEREGGFARIDKVFEGHLRDVVELLGEEVWRSVG